MSDAAPPPPTPPSPDFDGAGDDDIRDVLRDVELHGRPGDVELAMARVTADAHHRKVRDRAAMAGAAAAVLMLVIFGLAWLRSGPDAEVETAGDDRTTGSTTAATTPRTRPVYVGDPEAGTTDTTGLPPITDPELVESTTTTGAPGPSTSTTAAPAPSSSTPAANPPNLKVVIDAEQGTVKAGERAWFRVQVHNTGGPGTYDGNDCVRGLFQVTVAPDLPGSGAQPVAWNRDPATFGTAVRQGGGVVLPDRVVGGRAVGAFAFHRFCTLARQVRTLAPGETINDRVAVDLTAPPGQQLATSYTVTAEFSVDGGASGSVKASDSTTLNVSGSVPGLPGDAALQAVANAPSVSGWVAQHGGDLELQSRYSRGAWEVGIGDPRAPNDVLRIRFDATGTLLDVRTVRPGSAASDDPGATAPTDGERKLFP